MLRPKNTKYIYAFRLVAAIWLVTAVLIGVVGIRSPEPLQADSHIPEPCRQIQGVNEQNACVMNYNQNAEQLCGGLSGTARTRCQNECATIQGANQQSACAIKVKNQEQGLFTTGSGVPERCKGIEGVNQQSACIIEVNEEIRRKCAGKTGQELDECSQQIMNERAASSDGLRTDCQEADISKDNCGIVNWLLKFINGLSAIVGIVIVIMIIVGGIQYSAAGANPQATQAAKGRIMSAVVALLLYIFGFAFLQWVIPGGLF